MLIFLLEKRKRKHKKVQKKCKHKNVNISSTKRKKGERIMFDIRKKTENVNTYVIKKRELRKRKGEKEQE